MSYLILPRRAPPRQPQYAARISASGLGKHVVAAVSGAAGGNESLGGTPPQFLGSPSRIGTPQGLSWQTPDNSSIIYWDLPDGHPVYSLFTDFSFLWHGSMVSSDAYGGLLSIASTTFNANPFVAIGFMREQVASTCRMMIGRDPNEFGGRFSNSGFLPFDGAYQTWICTADNGGATAYDFWLDAVSIGDNGGISGSYEPNFVNHMELALLSQSATHYTNAGTTGTCALAAIFDVKLPADAVRSLTINPWQIFAPEKRYFFFSTAGGPQVYEEDASDGLYMKDQARKEELHQRSDGFLLQDTRASEHLIRALDKILVVDPNGRQIHSFFWYLGLLLSDSAQTDVTSGGAGPQIYERSVTDYLYLFDRVLKVLDALKREGLNLADFMQKDLAKLIVDRMYVNDAVRREELHQRIDSLSVYDVRLGQTAALQLDRLLLLDARRSELSGVRQDGLFLRDSRAGETSFLRRDNLLLRDTATREILKNLTDGLLLYDTATAQKIEAGGALYEISAADGLLLGDRVVREILKLITDKLLLGDSVSIVTGRDALVAITDYLLVSDRVRKEEQHQFRDYLLLVDLIRRDFERSTLQTDKLLLGDRVAREFSRTRYAADFLYLIDRLRKDEQHGLLDYTLISDQVRQDHAARQQDKVLLSDQVLRELARTRYALDTLYLKSLVDLSRGTEIFRMDSVLFADSVTRLQELLRSDGVYLSDTVAAVLTQVNAEFIVWARLQMINYMGINVRTDDLLGRKLGAVDFLGRSYGRNKWRLQ